MADAGGWIEAMLADVASQPVGTDLAGSRVVSYSPTLGRRIRADEFVGSFWTRPPSSWGFFRGLTPAAIVFLEERGVARHELTELNRCILAMLDLPDGRAHVSCKRWAEFDDEVRRCISACGAHYAEAALALLAELKEIWRPVQDRDGGLTPSFHGVVELSGHIGGILVDVPGALDIGPGRIHGRYHKDVGREKPATIRRGPDEVG